MLTDVPSDGNCGYHCLIQLLATMGRLEIGSGLTTVTSFRQELHAWVLSNKENYGRMSFFRQLTGDMNSKKRKISTDGLQERDRILQKIFCPGKTYESGCAMDEWLDTGLIVPLVMMKYEVSKAFVFEVAEGVENTIVIENNKTNFCLDRVIGLVLPDCKTHFATMYLVHHCGCHFMYIHPPPEINN